MTRGKYDLMITLKEGRCPRCRAYLVTNLAGDALTCCMYQGCHMDDDFPTEEVADAARQFMRRKGTTVEDYKMRSGG